MNKQQKQTFLLGLFHEFYSVLEELKYMAGSGTWVFMENGEDKKEMSDVSATSGFVFQRLVSLFEEQEMRVSKNGSEFGQALFKDALFIMTAIADETFLTMKWIGQEAWSRYLLETKFFSSNAGGDIFYNRLDALLKERDAVHQEIAIMFLLALSLGFRGKYLGVNDSGIIDSYKEQLFSFIFHHSPDLGTPDKKIYPSAYMYTLEKKAKTVIPGLRKWYGLLAALIVSLLGISHILWMSMTGEIGKIVLQILAQQ